MHNIFIYVSFRVILLHFDFYITCNIIKNVNYTSLKV